MLAVELTSLEAYLRQLLDQKTITTALVEVLH